ncbi:MAG TPA: hypothetical protein VFW22_02720 [Pseudolabrys sp.]|nr:hypothetical protein [Pseudolabrys sp.]
MAAPAAWAEQWIDIGTNSAFRPELQKGLTFCIDKDSVKTDGLGWTSYRVKLCNDSREVFESSVQCAQNLSADQVPVRQRTLVANGKSIPDQPWKTDQTYMSSIAGRLVKFACSQPHKPKAAKEPAPQAGTMAAEVLAHLEATKDYRELSALHSNKVAADSHWLQSAEGRAVDAQLKNWRSDAAATVIVNDKEGRVLRYSVGGMAVTDQGVAVADLEKSLPYKRTIAEAIAQNILTSRLDPKVQAALAAFRSESAAPAAGAAPKDRTVATWTTTTGTPDSPYRTEYSLIVHGGVLELQTASFCKGGPALCPPQGDKSTRSIKLANVKAFAANTFENQDRSKVYRIGLEARGAHDLLEKARSGTSRSQGMPGFALFQPDQQALRDETYKKLCAMIGQTP